jgi:hypothetical protein
MCAMSRTGEWPTAFSASSTPRRPLPRMSIRKSSAEVDPEPGPLRKRCKFRRSSGQGLLQAEAAQAGHLGIRTIPAAESCGGSPPASVGRVAAAQALRRGAVPAGIGGPVGRSARFGERAAPTRRGWAAIAPATL